MTSQIIKTSAKKNQKDSNTFLNGIKSQYLYIVCLVVISVITYVNILPNKLFFDDEELIYKNIYIQNFRYFPKYFTENMIAGAGKISNMYRPILLVSFAIDHGIWGLNPFGYHITSIMLHTLNAVLVFLLLLYLFKNSMLSFLTSLLFTVHPIQSEAVIYASGRTDPLYTFFSLLSLLCILAYIKKPQLLSYGSSLIFFILALGSKETTIIVPALMFIIILFQIRKITIRMTLKIIFILLPFLFVSIGYIALRLTVLNFSNTLNFYSISNIYSTNIFVRFYTFTLAFFNYLGILFFPTDLIIARTIPVVTSAFNPNVITFVILISVLTLLSILKKSGILLFSIAWFLISIFPVSGVIPINNIIAEHYLYLPSLSIFLIIVYSVLILLHRIQNLVVRILIISLGVSIINMFIFRTIIRTFDWRDPITFYTLSLKQNPNHIPMRNNLAMAYAEQGDITTAIKEYQTIISLGDIYPQPHHNLGNAYFAQQRYNEAEIEYKKALKIDPNFYFSVRALKSLYEKTDQKTKLETLTNIYGLNL